MTQADTKEYTDHALSYTVSYPDTWFPSGIVYGNAFEIRNYPAGKPDAIPEKNKASVIIVNTPNENDDATNKFLDSLLEGRSTSQQGARRLLIDGHSAVTVRREMPAQKLSPGAAGALQRDASDHATYVSIATYIADGRQMIAIEGSVRADADPSVIQDIMKIESGLTFTKAGANRGRETP